MRLYLDASALLPLFIQERRTAEAHDSLRGNALLISDFAVAEFSSGVARRARRGEIDTRDVSKVFADFYTWIFSAARRETLTAGDVASAIRLVRQIDLKLRTPDAINIAIAQRCDAHLLTFDETLARSARALGINVVS